MPRKSNVSKVMKACQQVGVKVEPMEAQQIVNICVRLGVGFIKKMVKPKSVVKLLQAYLRSLEPTGQFAGADKIYDQEKRDRGEIRQKKDKGFTKLTFSPAKRQASKEK